MVPSTADRDLELSAATGSMPRFWCLALSILVVVGYFLPAGKIFADPNDYLTFHSAVELLSISIALMVFSLAWNLRDQARSGQGLVLGLGFLSVAVIDLAHALAFPGMPGFFAPSDLEKGIYFWLCARTVAALTLLLVALWNPPPWSRRASLIGLAGTLAFTAAVCWIGVSHFDWVPRTFIPGQGLTSFKITSEYVLALAYGTSALLLYKKVRAENYGDAAWLAAAAWVLALAELFFTLYSAATDLFNFLGHIYKAIAYLMVYRALFVEGVRAPYDLLAVERLRLRTIIEAIPDLVWLKDPQGKYLLCNPAFEKLFGAREDQIVGKTDHDFVDRQMADFFREKDRVALESEGPTINEETLQFASNGYRGVFETKKTRLIGHGGAPIGVLGISRDISEAKRAQAELSLARDTLEEQVRQRTAQLSEAKEAAEAATLAKANFLANMSHEIRTPLNAVLGMAHLALSASPDPRLKNYIRKILQSGQHLMGVLNDILDFSKIDAGKMPIEHIPLDVEHLLQEASDMVVEKCTAKGIELIVDLPAGVPRTIAGDPLHLRQILINYLNNAVKFTEKGEIVLSARLLGRDENGSGKGRAQLQFEVRDTGVGIEEPQRRQLFRSFQQGDSSTTRRYGGTGLGLAIAKRLAEAMDGEVGVDSEPGRGSTFWFRAAFDLAGDNPEIQAGPLAGLRVLLAEPNAHASAIAAALLTASGMVARAMRSGESVLAEVTRAADAGTPYDLVVLNRKLSDMTSLAVLRKLRALPLQRQPRVVITADPDRGTLEEQSAGLDVSEVVSKPLTASMFRDALLRAFGVLPQAGGEASAVTAAKVTETRDLHGCTALVVEDNDLNQEVARELLRENGLEPDIASNGAEALARLEQKPDYHVVLMDVQMPVMDGIEATRRLRLDPRFRTLPIIAMTASALQQDREECLAAGMNDYIAKPIDPEALARALQTWVKPGRPAAGAPPVPPVETRGKDLPVKIPAGIDGLDSALGLRRSGGNTTLYVSLVRRFAAAQGATPGNIAAALAKDDWLLAERLAHTLKGVAGTIGATRVQSAAARLEVALKERRPSEEIDRELASLASLLAVLIGALDRFSGPRPGGPPASVDPERLAAVCRRLEELLVRSDAEANEVLHGNRDLLETSFPADYRRMEDLVSAYDYEGAVEVLRRAPRSGSVQNAV